MHSQALRIGISLFLIVSIPLGSYLVSSYKKGPREGEVLGTEITKDTITTDSDGDGLRDWEERMQGTDPFVPTDREKTPIAAFSPDKTEALKGNPPAPETKPTTAPKSKPTMTSLFPVKGSSGTQITITGQGFGSRALVYTGFGIERVSSTDGKTLSYTLKGPSSQNIKPGDTLPDGSTASSSDVVPVPQERSYPLWVYVQTEAGFAGPLIFTYEEIIGS